MHRISKYIFSVLALVLLISAEATQASGGNESLAMTGKAIDMVLNGNDGSFLLMEDSKTGLRRFIFVNPEVTNRYIGDNEIVVQHEFQIYVRPVSFVGKRLETYTWLIHGANSLLSDEERRQSQQYELASNFVDYLQPVRQEAVLGETRGCPALRYLKAKYTKCTEEVRNGIPWQCVSISEFACP